MLAIFSGVEFLKTYQNSEEEKESLFMSTTQREIVVVQRRQRNVQKRAMHVQSCCLYLQSVSMFFKFVYPFLLLRIRCVIYNVC